MRLACAASDILCHGSAGFRPFHVLGCRVVLSEPVLIEQILLLQKRAARAEEVRALVIAVLAFHPESYPEHRALRTSDKAAAAWGQN